MHLNSVAAASGYVQPPEFNQLCTVTLAVYNNRKGVEAKPQKADKADAEAALREAAKLSQREVSFIISVFNLYT